MYWLPASPDWSQRVSALPGTAELTVWQELVKLARVRLDFPETVRLDRVLRRRFGSTPPAGLDTRPVRLSILSSSTVEHLFPGLRVGALRHGLWTELHTPAYGQYLQELLDPASSLHQFAPDTILFAFDAAHLFGGNETASANAAVAAATRIRDLWRKARESFRCAIVQQTVLPTALPRLGHNEHRLPGAPLRLIRTLNEQLRAMAAEEGVDLLALDEAVSTHGLTAWHDTALWHRAKQEVTPLASPHYGEFVARLLAARQGRSAKCLVLDLDNTLWGGVIGDDGLDGIKLGQGSALGESFVAFQQFARDLSRRGIILAVCSKNDEANALAPFEKHPEMLLRRSDIACFVANWDDKATNLRRIAQTLNIGLDALVFADDNPFERNLVRTELPMVSVPELPEEPALYAQCLADAGYFETLTVTDDDLERSRQYQANLQREALKESTTDLGGYLRALNMELQWAPFSTLGLQRIMQLINKTNQFNLTTRRYTEPEVEALLGDPGALTLQLRLIDRFGDNGIIGLIIGRLTSAEELDLDTWLMSCRVLGRGVEKATLNLIAAEAARLGARRLVGTYRPSAKNGMVREHYSRLGFAPLGPRASDAGDGSTQWTLDLATCIPAEVPMILKRIEA